MRKYPFKRNNRESLIIIPCQVGLNTIALALAGASHTTFDLTQILLLGYTLDDAIRKERVETSGGIIETYVFTLPSITCMGITRQNLEVSAYDFFAFNIIADFDGVLGLDLLEEVKLCINLKQEEITVQPL